jgi:hypothetical protein
MPRRRCEGGQCEDCALLHAAPPHNLLARAGLEQPNRDLPIQLDFERLELLTRCIGGRSEFRTNEVVTVGYQADCGKRDKSGVVGDVPGANSLGL